MKKIKIDVKKLAEAPIDDKNVMSDWLVDTLFDEQEYTGYGHEYMGFVGGFPTYMTYQENEVKLRFLKRPLSDEEMIVWNSSIVEKLTGNDYKTIFTLFGTSCAYIDDERENYMKLIVRFLLCKNEATVHFYWDVTED